MTSPQQPRSAAAIPCPCCGGSGMLRLGDQRYRTCMNCLGQGRLLAATPATTFAEVLQAEVIPLEPRRINASVSSSAAR